MTEPADQIAARQGRFRASHADREQVVGALQAAFVQGRLTADELDERVGQALAARTYADLGGLTADLPADAAPARQPAPAQHQAAVRRPQNPAASFAVKAGAAAIGVTAIAATAAASHLRRGRRIRVHRRLHACSWPPPLPPSWPRSFMWP